ncbi:hypothetical protein BD779DRAFT_1483203, partial [Infundibulicybe gibba]
FHRQDHVLSLQHRTTTLRLHLEHRPLALPPQVRYRLEHLFPRKTLIRTYYPTLNRPPPSTISTQRIMHQRMNREGAMLNNGRRLFVQIISSHRGKCLARHQRRAQKAAEIAEMRSRKQSNSLQEEDELISDNDEGSADPESEEGVDSQAEEERARRREARRQERHKAKQAANSLVQTQSAWDHGGEIIDDVDAEGDSYVEEENPPPRTTTRLPTRRPWPVGLADLDSPSGRKNFIFASVDYLFATTYEASDDMSISALLTYLNSAMPQDKHEDFDTSEVIKAASALQEKGRIVFEGDMLRSID